MGNFSMLRVTIICSVIFIILLSTKFVDRVIGRRMTGIGKILVFVILMVIVLAIFHFVR